MAEQASDQGTVTTGLKGQRGVIEVFFRKRRENRLLHKSRICHKLLVSLSLSRRNYYLWDSQPEGICPCSVGTSGMGEGGVRSDMPVCGTNQPKARNSLSTEGPSLTQPSGLRKRASFHSQMTGTFPDDAAQRGKTESETRAQVETAQLVPTRPSAPAFGLPGNLGGYVGPQPRGRRLTCSSDVSPRTGEGVRYIL